MPKKDQVAIRLGDGPPAVVTRRAFETVWKDKGWTLVANATIDATGHVDTSAAAQSPRSKPKTEEA